MPDLTLRPVAPHESALIYSFLTIAARMEESGEPIQKALTDPALIKYWQNWGQPTDLGIGAESAELRYPVGGAWVRRFPGKSPGYGHVSDDIPELAFGVVKNLRNQGIGTLLLERLIADGCERFPCISLNVRRDNASVRLYERLGFRQHGDSFTNRVGTASMTMLLRFLQRR